MSPIDRLIAACRERRVKIAVVGDTMRDEYAHGDLYGCQDGCPKFVFRELRICDGGAGNAAAQLDHWNADVKLFMLPGQDPRKRRYLVDGKIVFREDFENYGYGISSHRIADERESLLLRLIEFIPDAILVSDYHKGTISEAFMTKLTMYAHGRKIPIVSDAKREPAFYSGTILKCNSAYARKYHPTRAIHALEQVVVTDGKEIPRLGWSGNEEFSVAPVASHPVQSVNHVGAGDCFAAHLVLGLVHGLPLADAAQIAHSAGRVYVQHEHNRAPWPHEIRRDIDPVAGKVVHTTDLGALCQSIRGRIVFTNGCFRVPHAGHTHLLNWARQQGAALVVGINDDESAARLRHGQYVMPLAERCAILASMQAVDWIVPFSESTPREVIAALKPSIIVKGPEYQGTDVPGADLVDEVMFCPTGVERHSTSLVEEIRQ